MVDLKDVADRLVSAFSGGMKRRLSLAIALMGKPNVVYLDEVRRPRGRLRGRAFLSRLPLPAMLACAAIESIKPPAAHRTEPAALCQWKPTTGIDPASRRIVWSVIREVIPSDEIHPGVLPLQGASPPGWAARR